MLLPCAAHAQQINLDSLFEVWNDSKRPHLDRLSAMNIIAFNGFLYSNPDTAYHLAQQQLELANTVGSMLYASKAIVTQAESRRLTANYKEALELFSNGLRMKDDIGDVRGGGHASYGMGLCYVSMGQSQSAISSYRIALNYYEQANDSSGISKALIGLGSASSLLSRLPQAQEYYRQSLNIAIARADSQGIAYALTNIGRVAHDQGDYETAVTENAKAILVFERLRDYRGMSGALISLGAVEMDQGRTVRAMRSFMRSLALSEANKDSEHVAIALSNLGDLHFKYGDMEKALEYYTRCLSKCESIGSQPGKMYTLEDLGNLHITSDPDRALGYFHRCRALADSIEDVRVAGSATVQMGKVFRLRRDYERAIEHVEEGLSLLRTSGYVQGVAIALSELALAYEAKVNMQTAMDYALESYNLARRIGAIGIAKDAAEVLVRVCRSTGDCYEAYRYHLVYSTMVDSLEKTDNVRLINKHQLQYDLDLEAAKDSLAQHASREHLSNESYIARLSTSRQQSTSRAIGGLGIMLLLGGGLVLSIDRRRRKHLQARRAAHLQTQVFRAQINPQFIHTALQNINEYVQANERDLASYFLTRFARLMRAVLENARKDEVPLAADLAVLQDYLELEKVRTGDGFMYSIEVEPGVDAEEVMVPPMLLQPYAEQAIWSRLANKSGIGHLVIRVQQRKGRLILLLEDDGEAKGEVRSGSESSLGAEGAGITEARLALLSKQGGEEASVTKIALPKGQCVELILPLSLAA